ncbi:hypothetical protein B0A55_01747 [Friedmanniomyces simplex]|uniref:Uncharacterized protein n=1 Tax=Friedmanniomyces simplex TaxID=329884 RepID=A0A4U0XTW5_9PEZI|nr:hypothetical protein B0A55_01747 [Friedmanniomyces simplex]
MTSEPVYKPISLDVISRPNPVEPQSIPQRHPLNGTLQLSQASNKDLLRLLYDANGTLPENRPAKRSKLDDGKSMDLPKLPVRQNTKRLRIPPTLSGLHQPPPNAGLLPSISTEQPEARQTLPLQSPKDPATDKPILEAAMEVTACADPEPALSKTGKPKRNKWSDEETACLLKGVARFGVGNWTKILNCPDYHFLKRSALDLKDRFRVCCPNDYQRSKKQRPAPRPNPTGPGTSGSRPGRSDRKSGAELQDLGINQPFAKVQRRNRHEYSAAEDAALLTGFERHGSQWAAIRADEELELGHRTATDLRDRMRTKYPDLYAKAGLAPRPGVFPKPAKRGKKDEQPKTDGHAEVQRAPEHALALDKPPLLPTKTIEPIKQPQSSLLPDDDLFFGALFDGNDDGDDDDAEGITLDRGILDWPLDNLHSKPPPVAYEMSKTTMTIDPIATLNLPRPTVPQHANSGYSALPSLAAITAFNDFDMAGQLELPSLMLGSLESDGRSGGHFLGFDELLS